MQRARAWDYTHYGTEEREEGPAQQQSSFPERSPNYSASYLAWGYLPGTRVLGGNHCTQLPKRSMARSRRCPHLQHDTRWHFRAMLKWLHHPVPSSIPVTDLGLGKYSHHWHPTALVLSKTQEINQIFKIKQDFPSPEKPTFASSFSPWHVFIRGHHQELSLPLQSLKGATSGSLPTLQRLLYISF